MAKNSTITNTLITLTSVITSSWAKVLQVGLPSKVLTFFTSPVLKSVCVALVRTATTVPKTAM